MAVNIILSCPNASSIFIGYELGADWGNIEKMIKTACSVPGTYQVRLIKVDGLSKVHKWTKAPQTNYKTKNANAKGIHLLEPTLPNLIREYDFITKKNPDLEKINSEESLRLQISMMDGFLAKFKDFKSDERIMKIAEMKKECEEKLTVFNSKNDGGGLKIQTTDLTGENPPEKNVTDGVLRGILSWENKDFTIRAIIVQRRFDYLLAAVGRLVFRAGIRP